MFISTPDGLSGLCERLRAHKVIAVDTEFLREKSYHPKLCLIQVATADEAAAIDPQAISDLTPLMEVLADASVTKVFHACDQDLEVIYDACGCVVAPVFDTQLAAAFLGHRMQMGLGALVQHYLGIHLDKADGLTDWSRRPLDAEQLRYAIDDVLYLPRIYDLMMAELVGRDRLSWFEPEMAQLADPGRLRKDPREAYLRLKRSGSLTRRQLAVAREVCVWREQAASRHDLPRKWMLSDELVVEISRRAPQRADRLRRIRGTESLNERDVRDILDAVRRGLACDPADYPLIRHRSRPSAQADSVTDLMYALLRLVSDRYGVAVPLIATRDDLYAFAAGDPACPLREGWRYEVCGRTLDGLLAGEVGLTVKDGRVETL